MRVTKDLVDAVTCQSVCRGVCFDRQLLSVQDIGERQKEG